MGTSPAVTMKSPPVASLQSTMNKPEWDVLQKADYAFTGSYYKVPRSIMSFNPLDLMPNFNGKKSHRNYSCGMLSSLSSLFYE